MEVKTLLNYTAITPHVYIDFALIHIFSIIFSSGAGLSIKNNELSWSNEKQVNPVIALYAKGLPVKKPNGKWKTFNNPHSGDPTPCLTTTCYSVQLLIKTANLILQEPWYIQNQKLSSRIAKEFIDLSVLQLEYCIENLESSQPSMELYTSLLKGCLMLNGHLKAHQGNSHELYSSNQWIETLYKTIKSIYNTQTIDTFTLSNIVETLGIKISQMPLSHDYELLTETALEIMHRRNSLGLFQKNGFYQKTAPLGWQFHCIGSLIISYPLIDLDIILEQAFTAFNRLYDLAWKKPIGYFSFGRGPRVKYTPFDIGIIIRTLARFAPWVSEVGLQDMLLGIIKESYTPFLDAFFKYYQREICHIASQLIPELPQSSLPPSMSHTLSKAPVFPDSILVKQPGRRIVWESPQALRIKSSLQLCLLLLDSIDKPIQKESNTQTNDIDWLESLLNLLSS